MPIGAFAWSAERAGMPETRVVLPREEWISFIPGAHPGYITLEQYDANCARLTASAAAHGRDRRSGPPREGTALRGRSQSREVPTYMCQHDGIENGRQACAAIPGEGLDRAIGQLLIDTLTPLTAEAALTVQAELEHRAEETDAPPTSSAPATTPTWPAAAIWPSTPPAGSSPAPSKPAGTPRSAPSAKPRKPMTRPARKVPASSPAPRRPGSASWPPTCPPSGTTPPPRCGNASASPGCCSPTSP